MALLSDVKTALRISETTTDFDGEIQDLIDAAKTDLGLSGVMSEKVIDTDPLIKRAVIVYCKANFGYDNPDAERFHRAYDLLKTHLSLSVDYAWFTITFAVTSGGNQVGGATITIGDDVLTTNSLGVATYTVNESGIDVDYVVTADGYETVEGSVYVDGDKDVEVVLIEA